MNFELLIDDFNVNQFERVFELFSSYFDVSDKLLSVGYLEWLYLTNPYGHAKVVRVLDGDRWIGFMAMIPIELAKRESRLLAYYVVNVLVHPDYHGKNIFGKMIAAAKEFVRHEGSALMGHPNDMALKSWKRAEMHFHESLSPYLVVPRILSGGASVKVVTHVDDLRSVVSELDAQLISAETWNVAITADYINWRYLANPVNSYLVQLLDVNGASVGFSVSKKVRSGVSLLVDRFMLESHVEDGFSKLPWLTVYFRSKMLKRELIGGFLPVPVRKKIPFFLTCYEKPFLNFDVVKIGLSASDF